MTIPAQDQDAALDLLVMGYETLQQKDSRHELLRYITKITPNKILFCDDLFEEFNERFGANKNSNTYTITRYVVALDNAAGQVDDRKNGIYELSEDVLLPF